jgi:hypothetical protein
MIRWLIVLALVFLGLTAPKWILGWQYSRKILEVDQAPSSAVAIVFGAGLRRDGTPTTVLADRVDTAVDLFRAGKVGQLLMTASTREGYDEPSAMAELPVRWECRTRRSSSTREGRVPSSLAPGRTRAESGRLCSFRSDTTCRAHWRCVARWASRPSESPPTVRPTAPALEGSGTCGSTRLRL